MADDKAITAAELIRAEEEENGGSDIEQGLVISENTDGPCSSVFAAISGGTSTPTPSTTTTWPPGDLEHVDDEDVAPVPLIQQIVDMGIEKNNNGNTKINTYVAPSDDASMTPQPDGNESIEGGPVVQQMGEHEYPRNEEDIQQRVVVPENRSGARQDISAGGRNPSLPLPTAYMVEDEESGIDDAGYDIVYEATPLEPELPWWKQRRIKLFMAVNCVLMVAIALAVGLGVAFSRPAPIDTATIVGKATPSGSRFPTKAPTKPSYKCFADRDELKAAVDQYVAIDCFRNDTLCSTVSSKYGWPIGSWCVSDVTNMSSLFQGRNRFNEDVSGWNVGRVADMSSMFSEAYAFNSDISGWNTS
jgi:hypothetical protein